MIAAEHPCGDFRSDCIRGPASSPDTRQRGRRASCVASLLRLPLALATLSLLGAGPSLAQPADPPQLPAPAAQAQTTAAAEPSSTEAPAALPSPSSATPTSPSPSAPSPRPSSSPGDWSGRVSDLLLGLESGTRTHADADALYAELCAELWPLQTRVHDAIRADAPDLIAQHARLRRLYAERSRLFGALSPSLRDELTGLDDRGRAEFGHEARYLAATLEYQQHILESALQHVQANVRQTPSATLSGVFRLVVLVVLFRAWRRWARKAVPQWRKRLLAARPRRRINLRLSKLLWYFERVRGPVEWLALLWVITLLARPPGFEELATLISAAAKWLFVGVLAVRIIDAMVARGAAGLRGGNASLRLQSLRLVGGWGVLLGLGLDLGDHYAGDGVIYAWIVRAWIVLSLPIALVLVRDWRGVIFEKLQEQARHSTTAARLARYSSGFGSYAAATAGAALLLFDGLVRFGVQLLSGSETGRRVIALLVRREVAREMERDRQGEGEPIADEIILPLVAAREVVIEEVARLELGLLVDSIETHGGGVSVVVGERGAGKTVFLDRIAKTLGDSMRVLACPPGGWQAFEQMLGGAFGVTPGDDFARRLGKAIEAQGVRTIGIDDLQLLPRPTRGGQEALVRMVALGEGLGVNVSWIFSVDRHAWRYILRAGAERAMLHDVIELPAWTEEQLAEMVAGRSAAVDLAPDYGRLLLPRQLDAIEYDTVEERNRMGYARVLWELSDGNPAVALYLFAESLHRLADGKVVVRLPQLRSASSLADAHPDALLVLRSLVQCDVASVEDVARSVRLSPQRVVSILRFCERNQWVVVEEGRYRVSWRWFRSLTRALARKNLLAR